MKRTIKILVAVLLAAFVFSCNKNPLDSYNHSTDVSVKVDSVRLPSDSLKVYVNEATQMTATVYPKGATNKNVTWSSSDDGTATISELGVLIGKAKGFVVITVTTVDGGYKDKCVVWVDEPDPVYVESVLLDQVTLDMVVGDESTLHATVEPEDAYDRSVTWSSSDNSVATVVDGVVKALAPGMTTVTVTTVGKTKDGLALSANCTVTVSGAPVPPAPVEKVDGDVDDITYEQSTEKE